MLPRCKLGRPQSNDEAVFSPSYIQRILTDFLSVVSRLEPIIDSEVFVAKANQRDKLATLANDALAQAEFFHECLSMLRQKLGEHQE